VSDPPSSDAPSSDGRWNTEAVRAFYDDLAPDYRLLFPDWRASSARQAAVLDRLIEAELGTAPPAAPARRLLDVAAGVGTQLLGLAARGYRCAGSDLSPLALHRAAAEAAGRDLALAGLAAADFRRLPFADRAFDVVVCADNALPHLLTAADVVRALRELRRVTRAGGAMLVSTRDYDEARRTRPVSTPVQVSRPDGGLAATFQLWTWHDDGQRYDLEHVMVHGHPPTWRVGYRTAGYWAITRAELATLAAEAGLDAVRWLLPAESGYVQPLLVARA